MARAKGKDIRFRRLHAHRRFDHNTVRGCRLFSFVLQQAVHAWCRKRESLQEAVPSDLLGRYDRIKQRNQGIGVTPVWKGVCGGCHMNIPPQLYNELQRSEALLICPNCNRIMYFHDREKTDNPS